MCFYVNIHELVQIPFLFFLILTFWCVWDVGYFPNLVLLIPHCVLLGIMLSTRPAVDDDERHQAGLVSSSSTSSNAPAGTTQPSSSSGGIADARWQENLQAIQNLMGAV
jgi:hypothetical protein